MAENTSPDVSKILSTIREVESGNNYSTSAKGSSASGAYQFIDSTWRDSTKKFGIGTEYARAKDAPPEIQDAVAAAAVTDILQRVGGDVSKVPIVWYTGNPQGQMTEAALKANQGLTPDRYQQKWLSVFNKGQQPTQTAQGPRTTEQAKPVQVAAAQPRTLTDLPPSYRMALAANYIADTESPETSVVERAMEMISETQGGASKNPMTAFNQSMEQQPVDPFAFVLQQPEEQQPQMRRKPVPRMPVRMANGGDVSKEVPQVDAQGNLIREAPVPDRPLSLREKIVGGGEAALSLLSGITAPASIAYDVLRGTPRQEVSPARFMYTPRTEAGQEMAQDVGRFMQEYKLDAVTPQAQLMRPFPAAVAARQGIAALELPGMAETPPAGILRLPGGTFVTNPESSLSQMIKRTAQKAKESALDDPEKAAAASEMFTKKAFDFYTKRAGSPMDELKQELIAGRIKVPEDMDPIFPKYLLDSARKGDLSAMRDLERRYDEMLGIEQKKVLTKDLDQDSYLVNQEFRQSVAQGMLAQFKKTPELIPDQLLYQLTNKDPTDVRIRIKDNPEYFTTVIEPKIQKLIRVEGEVITPLDIERYSSSNARFDPKVMTPTEREAVRRGEPLIDLRRTYPDLFGYDMDMLAKQAGKMSAKELKDITFATFVSRASKLAAKEKGLMAQADEIQKSLKANKPVDPKLLAFGTQEFIALPDGFQWRKITDPDATIIHSAVMDNSIRGYSNYGAYGPFSNGRKSLENGMVELYALYNPDGVPVTNVEMVKGMKSGQFSMRQAYGNGPLTKNVTPEDYMPQLKALVNKLKPTDLPYSVSEQMRYIDAPEGFAKGGIVDKPLYDRAA